MMASPFFRRSASCAASIWHFSASAIALGFQAVVVAQEPEQKLPDPARGYQWREAARKIGELSAKEIEQLAGTRSL